MKTLFIVLFLSVVGVFWLSKAHAEFVSHAVSSQNTFTTADAFPTTTQIQTASTHVVINEVNPNGDDWVEIYNPTDSSVDISGWKIHDNSSDIDSIPASTTIPSKGYGVIVAKDSPVVVPDSAIKITLTSAIGNGLAAGSDSLFLKDATDTAIIDSVVWDNISEGKTLSRIPNGNDTDNASDWQLEDPTIGVSN